MAQALKYEVPRENPFINTYICEYEAFSVMVIIEENGNSLHFILC